MEETGCHIHFPDSNRHSQGEKSNQVDTHTNKTSNKSYIFFSNPFLSDLFKVHCGVLVQQREDFQQIITDILVFYLNT